MCQSLVFLFFLIIVHPCTGDIRTRCVEPPPHQSAGLPWTLLIDSNAIHFANTRGHVDNNDDDCGGGHNLCQYVH